MIIRYHIYVTLKLNHFLVTLIFSLFYELIN